MNPAGFACFCSNEQKISALSIESADISLAYLQFEAYATAWPLRLRKLFLCKSLLDGLGELGNDLVEVAYDTVVCYVEDGSILILVDSDDDV